jgi:hypothetical protein
MCFFNIKLVFLFYLSLYSLFLNLIKYLYTIHLACNTFDIIISLFQLEIVRGKNPDVYFI